MKAEEIQTNLGLTPEQISEYKDWISSLSMRTKVSADEIEKLYVERVSEAVQARLNEQFEFESFMEYIKSIVTGDTMKILPPLPGIPIHFMPFGYFPKRPTRKEEQQSEIIGWGRLEEKSPMEITTLTASGPEAMLKRTMIEPCEIYDTVVSFNPEKKAQGMIRAFMHKDTEFNNNKVATPMSIEDRYKTIVTQYPVTTLANASNNLTKLIQFDLRNKKKSPPYPDRTDLKVIQVTIHGFQSGRRDNGIEWARYEVTDSSFTPTPNHKAFTVWVDYELAKKIGAGEGSFVKFLGTIEYDMNQQFCQMTACAIFPEYKVPLVEQAPALGGSGQSNMYASATDTAHKVFNINL